MKSNGCDQSIADGRSPGSWLDAAGWGLFFTWIGVALLADVGWAVGLIGVGIIMLGAQAARRHFGLGLEGFSLAVGFLFILGGIWEFFHVPLGLAPILCVLAGVTLVVSALVRGARG